MVPKTTHNGRYVVDWDINGVPIFAGRELPLPRYDIPTLDDGQKTVAEVRRALTDQRTPTEPPAAAWPPLKHLEDTNMSSLSFDAMMFAREVHRGQRRKYTGNPYSDHLAEVAGVVSTVAGCYEFSELLVATAWLHDCVEDQGVRPAELARRFGHTVATGVLALSDLEVGNRAERKAASRDRLAAAPAWVQTIKVADLISNTSSIVQHDPKFAAVYLEEKRLMLSVLRAADPRLVAVARSQITASRTPTEPPAAA